MSQVYPRSSNVSDLMEQIVPEQLKQIPVTSLRPAWVHTKPARDWERVSRERLSKLVDNWSELLDEWLAQTNVN